MENCEADKQAECLDTAKGLLADALGKSKEEISFWADHEARRVLSFALRDVRFVWGLHLAGVSDVSPRKEV